ncbi:MAG: hypothetical protein V1743_05530 [Nanoarchaeota archaeon]
MKKAQSAVEYLVTYGWIMIVVLIVIGLLIYFEVLSPNRFIAESCDFGQQLECIDSQIGKDGDIVLKLRNSFGDRINLTNITSFDTTLVNCAPELWKDGLIIQNGFDGVVYCEASRTFFPGEKILVHLKIFFKSTRPFAPTYNISGSLFRKVCSGTYMPGAGGAAGTIENC